MKHILILMQDMSYIKIVGKRIMPLQERHEEAIQN